MDPNIDAELKSLIEALQLEGVPEALPGLLRRAEQENWSHQYLLTALLKVEVDYREEIRLQGRLSRARLPFRRSTGQFDFSREEKLTFDVLEPCLSPGLALDGGRVVLIGPGGSGKTHLAVAIAQVAIQNGFEARFVEVRDMLDDLQLARIDGGFRKALEGYAGPAVLVLDALETARDRPGAAALIDELTLLRLERGLSMVVTSRVPPVDWHRILGEQIESGRISDRFTAGCHRIELSSSGDSASPAAPSPVFVEDPPPYPTSDPPADAGPSPAVPLPSPPPRENHRAGGPAARPAPVSRPVFRTHTHWQLMRSRLRFGLTSFLEGQPYYRTVEHPAALEAADLSQGQSVLDLGSAGTFIPVYMGRIAGCRVVSLDLILPSWSGASEWIRRAAASSVVPPAGSGVDYMQADIRTLPFRDASFDRVIAVSTIEHLRYDGDIRTMQEIGRVLKPGGRAVITVPMGWGGMEEFAATESVKFFERKYDPEALWARIVHPSGLELTYMSLFGETYPPLGAWVSRQSRTLLGRIGILVAAAAAWTWTKGVCSSGFNLIDSIPTQQHAELGVVLLSLKKPDLK